jgi:hypothetical protein
MSEFPASEDLKFTINIAHTKLAFLAYTKLIDRLAKHVAVMVDDALDARLMVQVLET